MDCERLTRSQAICEFKTARCDSQERNTINLVLREIVVVSKEKEGQQTQKTLDSASEILVGEVEKCNARQAELQAREDRVQAELKQVEADRADLTQLRPTLDGMEKLIRATNHLNAQVDKSLGQMPDESGIKFIVTTLQAANDQQTSQLAATSEALEKAKTRFESEEASRVQADERATNATQDQYQSRSGGRREGK